jgi:hypothetical protein
VILEDLLLLRLRGAVRPVPPRLADGISGERRKRELRGVPQIEPPFVSVAIRAGQGRRDVVITPALLHPEVGAANHRRLGAILQARELEEVPEEVPMRTDSQVPFAHRLKPRRT